MQPLGACHVEIGFVDGGHFHYWCELQKHAPHRGRGFSIALGMTFQKNRLRTEPRGLTQWHCRVHAKLARHIGRGGNHAALIGASAHDHGFALQRRIVELLHRDKKGVHIDMEISAKHKSAFTDCRRERGKRLTKLIIVGDGKFTAWCYPCARRRKVNHKAN